MLWRCVVAVLDHGHLTEPLALAHMTKHNRGSANLAQDFDLASNEAQYVFSRAVLVEKCVPLADSDEAARVYRTRSAHRSDLMPPTNPI